MNTEKLNGETLNAPDDVFDYIDKVATGEDFGKTPSTAGYKNLSEYWNDGTSEEQTLKKELWDSYRVAPAPERLPQFKQASEIFTKFTEGIDGEHYSTEQAVEAAANADAMLELSTLLGTDIKMELIFSRLEESERESVEKGLYGGDQKAKNRMKETQIGFNDNEKARRYEEIMNEIELRKALFEQCKKESASGFDSLKDEVPFAGNSME